MEGPKLCCLILSLLLNVSKQTVKAPCMTFWLLLCLQVSTVAINGIFLSLVMLLYLIPRRYTTALYYQRKLGVPLHIIAHVGGSFVFIVCSQTVKSVACSPFWADYCAVEGLIAHLLWPCLYPMFAGIPLSFTVPLQVFTCIIHVAHNPTLCRNGYLACSKAGEQYAMLRNVLAKFASSTPFANPDQMEIPFQADCPTVLGLMAATMLLVVSLYVTFAVELSSRMAFCVTTRIPILHVELWRRKPQAWQLVSESMVALMLAWYVMSLLTNIWALSWYPVEVEIQAQIS